MSRSHTANPNFDNHCHVMNEAVSRYSGFALDETFVRTSTYRYPEEIPGNQLIIQQVDSDKAVCLGEFRFLKREDADPWVRISVTKWLMLTEVPGRGLSSETNNYRYQIWLQRERVKKPRTSVIRFDNGESDWYGFETANHLHVQYDSDDPAKRDWPWPAHVALNFPYLSDVLDIGFVLATNENGPVKYFNELFKKFKAIQKKKKGQAATWIPELKDKLFEFILP